MKTTIVIPTYNEKENIEDLINFILDLNIEDLNILVADDNSPDGTGEIVLKISEKYPSVGLLSRKKKRGRGFAGIEGFLKAMSDGADYIIEMDADFSHDPEVIPQMVDLSKEHDVVIGSRYVCGINVVNWPLSRLILSYMASKYVQIITRMPVKDPTGGFKCIKIDVLKKIHLEKIMSDGYSFQIEINFRAWVNRFDIYEMPIIFTDRRSGQSKMSKKIIYEAVYMVWKLKLMQLLRAL